jgi:hypothetical protein
LSDVDGMVYRWKQGIQSLTKTDRVYVESSVRDERSPILTSQAFAGQDVMNVLSLLCTGQPYNYNSFLRAARDNGNALSSRDATGAQRPISYIEGVIRDLTRRNSTWGEFKPFKQLILNTAADQFVRTGEGVLTAQNIELRQLRRRRAQLEDDILLREAGLAQSPQPFALDATGQPQPFNAHSSNAPEVRAIRDELNELDAKIDRQTQSFVNNFNRWGNNINRAVGIVPGSRNPQNSLKIWGDDVSYDPTVGEAGSDVTDENRQHDRMEFRRKLASSMQRQAWQVRANQDFNLFIVDDQYDKNFDIQAFERRLGPQLNLFNSEYNTVDQQIKTVAQLLGLEIFADSQGHIRARPPQYNRMPASVFNKMFKTRDVTGIKVFPEFLESLFRSRLAGFLTQIEIEEDMIRLLAAALGIIGSSPDDTDRKIANFLRGSDEISGTRFKFSSNPTTGKILGKGAESVLVQASPEIQEEQDNDSIEALEELGAEFKSLSKSSRVFDPIVRTRDADVEPGPIGEERTKTWFEQIRNRLHVSSGTTPKDLNQLFSNDRVNRAGGVSRLDIVMIVDQMAQHVSRRQMLMVGAADAIRNLTDGLRFNSQDEGAGMLTAPFLNRTSGFGSGRSQNRVPEILEHMLEDEDNDDLGPGSGKRFVLKDHQVISFQIREEPPPWSLVQVSGLLGEGFVDPPNSLTTSQGGNAVTTAYAVDDPDTQCAPYAVYALNLARKNIIQATAEVAGYNEFYQAGDVVYFEDRDLLFYVEGVSHSLTYGGTLKTTLDLKYGHNPGEYIPTMLDIVGSVLYNAKGVFGQFRSSRFDARAGDQNIGAIVASNFDIGGFSIGEDTLGMKQILGSKQFGQMNLRVLNSALFTMGQQVNALSIRGQKPMLELRVYSGSGSIRTADLLEIADQIAFWFTNPERYSRTGDTLFSAADDKRDAAVTLEGEQIRVQLVEYDEDTPLSPSRAAWAVARMIEEGQGGSRDPASSVVASNNPPVDERTTTILSDQVIDIWLVSEDIAPSTQAATPSVDGLSEDAQRRTADVEAARQAANE